MSSFKRIVPLLNRIVVRKIDPQTKTASGIIVTKVESYSHGVVLEAGPGSYSSQGKLIGMSVKVGDKVLLPEYGGQVVKLGDQQLHIFKDTEIVAKLE